MDQNNIDQILEVSRGSLNPFGPGDEMARLIDITMLEDLAE